MLCYFKKMFVNACLCLAISANSHAALISIDSSFGADSITWDTETDLEWLDLSHSLFEGYSGITSNLGDGGIFEGFRLATSAELEVLFFTSAGISATDNSATATAVQNLISLVTDTFGDIIGPYSFLASTAFFNDGDSDDSRIGIASLEVDVFEGMATGSNVAITKNAILPTAAEIPPISSAWLVREAKVAAPAGAPLIGLLSLLWVLRARWVLRAS